MKCEQYTIYIQVLCTTHEQHTGARAHPLNAHIYIHTYIRTYITCKHTYIHMYVRTHITLHYLPSVALRI